MGLREEFQKRIDKKLQEISALQLQIAQGEAYIQALDDAMRLLPREGMNDPDAVVSVLRPNSGVAKAREAIKAAGKPLHINDLLAALGKPVTRESRGAITSSLAAYVRRGEIFTRTAPNTYGLVEFGVSTQSPVAPESELPPLPVDFGKT